MFTSVAPGTSQGASGRQEILHEVITSQRDPSYQTPCRGSPSPSSLPARAMAPALRFHPGQGRGLGALRRMRQPGPNRRHACKQHSAPTGPSGETRSRCLAAVADSRLMPHRGKRCLVLPAALLTGVVPLSGVGLTWDRQKGALFTQIDCRITDGFRWQEALIRVSTPGPV